jgi:ketosteroid isomerase-like protein
MKAIAYTLALCLSGCQPEPTSDAPLTAADVEKISELRRAFVAAELEGDRQEEAALFTDGGAFLETDAALARGREAIRSGLAEFDLVPDDLSFSSVEITGRGNVAFDQGTYSAEFTEVGVASPIRMTGKYLMVLRREANGRWRIAALMHE